MADVKIVVGAVDNATKVLSQVRSSLGDVQTMGAKLGGVLGTLGASFGAAAATAWVRSIVDGVDALNDLSDATGASIENVSALEDIAGRTGTSFDTVQASLLKFNQVLNSAEGGSKTAEALKAIGLSAEALKAIDPAEALRQTAVALAGFADDGNKARLTQELFGKSTKDVAAFLKDLAEQGKLVGTVTTEQTNEADKFNKQLFVLQKNAKDAARVLVSDFVPALNEVLATFSKDGLSAAIDGIGNRLFDWEGSQSRKIIKNLESDLASLNEQSSLITIDLFGKKGALAIEIEAKTKELEKARSLYLKLTDGSVGGGRGNVNPANVDARTSVKDSGGKDKPGSKGTDPNADFKSYLDNLQKQIEKTQNLTAVEQLLVDIGAKRLTVSAGQKQELESTARRIDGIKAEAEAQKALEDARKSSAKYIEDLLREQAAMEQSNQAMRDQLEEIGLGQAALSDLQIARIDATVALEQETLAMLANNNGSEAEIVLQERKIELLKQQRELTATTQLKTAATDAKKDADRASKEFADTLRGDLKGAFSAAFRDTGGDPLKAFGDALENMVFTRAATALTDALIEAATTQAASSFGSSSGAGGIGDFLSSLFSFDGGGSTGSGPRSGGLDGKGGFMALLHPQETVVDHTRGQTGMGGGVTIVQNIQIDSRSDTATIMAAMHQAKEMAKAEILQSRARGGAFA